MIAADVSSVARLLRGEAGKKKDGPEIVTMDLLGGGGGDGAAEDEVVDLEVSVPAGWERRLDLLSGKTFLTPRHPSVEEAAGQDLNLPPPASATTPAPAAPTSSSPFCTLDMVRAALERAEARLLAASSATSSTSSASTTSSSSSARKRNRSPAPAVAPQPATPAMSVAACTSCLTYVLIVVADPRCPRCSAKVPPLPAPTDVPPPFVKPDVGGRVKKPRIDLNAAADETE